MADTALGSILRHVRKLAEAQAIRDLGDGELLERFRTGGEEAAFTLLVQRHGPMVLSVGRRVLHDWHDAEDVFQATFLVLARKAGSIRKTASVASWLHGVAHRIAAKTIRRAARSRRRERRSFDMAGAEPLDELTWQELRSALDEEIAGLPEKYKAALVLHYLEGKSHEQAARELGWPKTSFSSRLARAREILRDRFARRGLALSVGLLGTALSERAAPAAVSALLVLSTVRGSSLAVAGKAAAGAAVSAQAAALAEEAVQAMNLSRLKVILAVVLSAGLAATGMGLAARQSSAPRPPQARVQGRVSDLRPDAPRLDADGRPLPAGAVHRLGSRRFRVEGWIDGFALPAPDGKHVLVQPQPGLSAYAAQGLMLVDLDTGLRVRSFEDSRRVPKPLGVQAIRPAAFSPDGKTLYAVGKGKDEPVRAPEEASDWAQDNIPCKRVLLVWDVATGKLRAEWPLPPGNEHGASLIGVNVSPDGKRLYVYGAVRMRVNLDRTLGGVLGLHVLDGATGKKLQSWDGAGHLAGMIAGGKEVVTFRSGAEITAYHARTGKPVRTFPIPGLVPCVVLSPDGKTIAAVGVTEERGKRSYEIKLWEAATGRQIRRLTAGGQTVGWPSARLVFAADGKTLYLGTGAGRILRWDLSSGRALPDWPAHSGMVADLFLRAGKSELVSAGAWDGALRRWDAATGKMISTTDAYVGRIAVARTPDGRGVAVGDWTGRLDLWDLATGRITRTLRLPGTNVNGRELIFSPDGQSLLDATGDGKITVRDAVTGKAVRQIPAGERHGQHTGSCAMTFGPDGRSLFASGEGYGTRLLTWPACKVVWLQADSYYAACSPDGKRMVCGNWNSKTLFRNPQSGAELSALPGEDMASAAFSPDGRRLATAHLYGVWRVRDGITGAVLKEVKGFQHVWCVAFSPTGWLLAVAGDNSLRVYDTASWQQVARFDGHDGTVGTVFFGPDDATLVSASAEDGTAVVWSLKPPAGRQPLDPARLWADLAGDGPAVRRAVWAAAQHPDAAVRLFRDKWPAAKRSIDPKQIAKLIADLDSPAFARREAATAELKKLGRPAEAALRNELAATASAEVKRRAEMILAAWAPPVAAESSAADARELRAVWALELAGTPEARKLLAEWAAAQVGNRLCEEAAAAVKRLQRRE